MNNTIFKNFIFDRAPLIAFYIVNTLLIITFFNLIHPEKIEIIYPLLLSFFLFVILIIIEWARYFRFNRQLQHFTHDPNVTIKPMTYEQKQVSNFVNVIQKQYQKDLNSQKSVHEEKDQFLYQWMHNLKTPISVIELMIQKYMGQTKIPSEALQLIRIENDRLHASIEQVLNMIRFEHFAMDYEAGAVDLVASIRNVINDHKNQFIYNKVFPVLADVPDKAFIISDKKWNEFILFQLISNAIKYSTDGKQDKKIVLSIVQDEKQTTLSIKDEGVGIPPYDLKRVFEPFFTGENGRTYRQSTGIGLYTCKQIAERLGHEIEISSEVGKGTEVTITYLTKL
ncbi:MAG: sensor histidine kinase [Anaerobacillus sp.]|uniref:sensor histidine kinase n=1 Tax=Anaerobacillus sp. TaxID=1872506 RepID=UPI003918EF1A